MTIELSIVTTLYASEPYLKDFYSRMGEAARRVSPDYEIILVNDGSPDHSLDQAIALHQQDPRLVIVDLSRNFGHHRAILTGLAYARGKSIFVIDSDLEEDPAWLQEFLQVMGTSGCDVVYGKQTRRKGLLFERLTGWAFYRLFNLLSSMPIPESATTARLMSRRYVDALMCYSEREVFLPALWELPGFKQVAHLVHKHSKGSTSYSFARKIALVVNALTSFSNTPLVMIFYTGLCFSGVAGVYIIWLFWKRFWYGIPLLGWPSLIVSIWFLGGLTIFYIGILGIYLAKIFAEIKERPRSVVRQVFPASRGLDVVPRQ